MDKDVIPVVFATDDNYVSYCGVAVSSLIHNACKDKIYKVYIFYDKLSQISIVRLELLSTEHVRVQCVCIHDYIAGLDIVEYHHLTIASVYRLVIPDVLSQYEKVIYLDSDIVVNADIADLYNVDIGNYILGAAHGYYEENKESWMYKHITQTLGIHEKHFFNAGILILNIAAFREQGITEKCFSLLTKREDLIYMDQCALNIVCENKVHFLPPQWNHEWLYLFSDTTNEQFIFSNPPAIIHYDGIEKPWDYPNQILSEYFWLYARKSVFYEQILQNMQIKRIRQITKALGEVWGFKNIAIYGAGNVGKSYVDKLLSLNLCNIVLWVDQNFSQKQGTKIKVEPIEKLYTANFDHVIIAINDIGISTEVRDMLMEKGIPQEKIILTQ